MVSHHFLMSVSQSYRDISEILGFTNHSFEKSVLPLKTHVQLAQIHESDEDNAPNNGALDGVSS